MSDAEVAVVGGGVIGLACAWELRRRGAGVVVLERGAVGAGASRGNTGWVSPSFTYPLPAPGMVREGLRQLVTGGEAFVLRPSLDPAFVRWLWTFRRSCSSTRFDAGVRALLALNRRTLELFDAYRDAGVAFEMHTAGLVVAARTPGGLDLYRRIFRRLRELGYEGGAIDELDGPAVAALEPALARSEVVAGLHARVDRFVRPEELTAGLAAHLRADGVEIREGAELRALAPRAGGWTLEPGSGEPVSARAGRRRGGPGDGPAAAPPRRARRADGRARLQRHGRRPRHAAAPRALPGRGQARPEPVRRRRAGRRRVRARRAQGRRRARRRRAAARRGAPLPVGLAARPRRPRRGLGRPAARDPGRAAADRRAAAGTTASISPPGTGCSA